MLQRRIQDIHYMMFNRACVRYVLGCLAHNCISMLYRDLTITTICRNPVHNWISTPQSTSYYSFP
ncbi:hypothetical protein X777_15480 [Ooceraea biroi]|uniref:Uncharacterized protein n=1 Tax=Ooceraea biroi TaxID=2015173 RepID=A0A026VVF2_OOCBI|nr:hypothetical protein X777_15480 [Ooceraea biroi]